MSYQLKYYYTFQSLKNNNYRVEIWENSSTTITASEITGDAKPFTVSYQTIKNKFDTVRGSGCELNLLSTTNMQFYDLYTADIYKYQVLFYDSSNTIIWTGYLDTELYRESFSQLTNYPVQFTGNDGFNLLERLLFVDDQTNNYTDIKSYWSVIQLLFNKLNLPINYIYISLSTTIQGVTIASNETVLHKSYINSKNFYDEDNKPFTCRKVLESVLRPYSCYIQQIGGNIYIVDINTVANGGNASFKQFDGTSFNYVQTTSLSLNIGDLNSIGYTSSNSTLDIESGINQQVIKFSPYNKTTIYKEDLTDLNDLTPVETVIKSSSVSYGWKEETFYNNQNYTYITNNTGLGRLVKMIGTGSFNKDEKDNYIILNKTLSTTGLERVFKTNNLGYLVGTGKNFLKIEAKVFVRTKDRLKDNTENSADNIIYCQIPLMLKVNYSTAGQVYYYWYLTQPADYNKYPYTNINVININNGYYITPIVAHSTDYSTTMADNWQNVTRIIDLPTYQTISGRTTTNVPINGEIELSIYQNQYNDNGSKIGVMVLDSNGSDITQQTNIKDIRIKDINLSITDIQGNDIKSDDIEYHGTLNKQFLNEGEKVDLVCGTNVNDTSTCLGGIMYSASGGYFFIKNWTREGQTNNIESLLLRSIISNYSNPSVKLSCSTNLITNILGYITNNNYLNGKKLMIAGIKQNFEDESSDVNLIEINKDNLSIT